MSKKRFQLKEASYLTSRRSAPPRPRRDTVTGAGQDTALDVSDAPDSGVSDSDASDSDASDVVSDTDRTQVELKVAEMIMIARELSQSLEFRPPSALRLLALWARLSRVDPRALPVPVLPSNPLSDACKCVRDNSAQLVEAVASTAVEQTHSWLERADRLKISYLDTAAIHPREQERNAISLLLDLDDMELARHAAAELNHPSASFSEAVRKCRHWLAENVHAFLSCGKTVAAELRIMRRDLPAIDRGLSQTIQKFLQIRTAIEEMDQDLSNVA